MAKARAKTKPTRPKAKRAKPATAKKRSTKTARPRAKTVRRAPQRAKPAKKPVKNSPVRKRAKPTVVPPDRSPPRAHHDMGGLPAGPVKPAEHDYALWEKRVDAMMVLLSDKKRGLMNTDMLRRGIESLPPDAYDRMSYYERWIHSIATMMLERGVVTRAELDARIARLRQGRGP